MHPHQVPRWIHRLFPERIWEGRPDEQRVYLTFDDGPVPGITDFVLDELQKREQKATFFMVGDNVRKHPQLALEVLQAGHSIGNHTFNHLHGFRTSTKDYLKNVRACDQIFDEKLGINALIFRPPYGMISPWQAKQVSGEKKIVMWSLLTGDYDRTVSPQHLLKGLKPRTRPGNIIVFHDQEKTRGHLQQFLPEYLDFLMDHGFSTDSL